MKRGFTRVPLALALSLMWLGTGISAAELQFTDLEQRLWTLEKKTFVVSGVEPAAFLQDVTAPPNADPMQAQPPRELGMSADCETSGQRCQQGCSRDTRCSQPIHGVYYTQVELYWMRTHINEGAVGKLSEQYELSPRFVIGYEDAGGVGGRVRYWTYGRTSPNLTSATDTVRLEFDVIDLEATSRFGNERSELLVGGGFRWAELRIELGDEAVVNEMPGITFAADLRTMLCRGCSSEWASVAGIRWSILGGDWAGSSVGFLSTERDDNITTTEIYGGFEYVQHYSGYNVFARLVFEAQNWHSDVAAQTAGSSIGFIGPGLHLGMNF